jgi:ATP-binding cassette subfamily D (ALD) long-chain fatty acid import protein
MSSRTKDFVTNRRLLLNTSDAFARIMYFYKEVSELAGYTARVSDMLAVFDDMKKGKYQKGAEGAEGAITATTNAFQEAKGTVIDSESISVEKLAIVSPNGDVLVRDLSFDAPPGTHMLITGPNGCGKSSLFRTLSGLWPVYEGTVRTPKLSTRQIFYIPQRPYLSTGTLRDQVIYPLTYQQVIAKGVSDQDLEKILDIVKLRYIVDREGGWDARNEWKDVLSGGEKQRIAMSRLFFHKPRYAILDECTSAVSIDIEGVMYNTAKEMGISLMTVSHRPSLWKYHDWLLEFDGEGHCRFVPINTAQDSNTNKSISQMTLEEEKVMLEKRMHEDEKRLKKIKDILS